MSTEEMSKGSTLTKKDVKSEKNGGGVEGALVGLALILVVTATSISAINEFFVKPRDQKIVDQDKIEILKQTETQQELDEIRFKNDPSLIKTMEIPSQNNPLLNNIVSEINYRIKVLKMYNNNVYLHKYNDGSFSLETQNGRQLLELEIKGGVATAIIKSRV